MHEASSRLYFLLLCCVLRCAALDPVQAPAFYTAVNMARLEHIPADSLFVSEPDPSWFGNGKNPKSNPAWTNDNWLKSRFHFSFAEYHDAERRQFGMLRVMNDDLVQPDRGFGTHPHANMEICTYVVEGELTHRDSMGTGETLGRGSIQFMTAGTGVRHSEYNLSKDSPLRFIQMWLQPRQRDLPPAYGSAEGVAESRKNRWAHLVADKLNTTAAAPVRINTDASILVTELDAAVTVTHSLAAGRMAYLLCMEGDAHVILNDDKLALGRHDAARVYGAASEPSQLQVTAGERGSHLLLVEMASA